MPNNFKVFKIAFIHNKFWAHNTIEVPEDRVSLNEDFHEIQDVLRVKEQYEHFQVYWISKGISGEICLPGEWNYAYIDGKYFHAVKMHSNGFVKGIAEEFFYYNLIYDDWQNEWLTNNFYLKGTLDLTGDPILARDNIHQIPPLLDNVNDYVFLNGIRRQKIDYSTKIQIPNSPHSNTKKNDPVTSSGYGFETNSIFTTNSYEKIQQLIRRFQFHAGEQNPAPSIEKLMVPFLFKMKTGANWKWIILRHATRLRNKPTAIFDVTYRPEDTGMATTTRQALQNLLHTNDVYFVATVDEGRTYVYGSKINQHKYCPIIDLSQCTDIVVYDQLTMLPLYDNRTTDNAAPKFDSLKLIQFLCEKWGWNYSTHADSFSRIFHQTAHPYFAPLIEYYSYDTDAYDVMEAMTDEKIERSIEDIADPRGSIKDPEWKAIIPTRIFGAQHHRNLIWDNPESNFPQGSGIYVFSGFKQNYDQLTESERNALRGKLHEDFTSGESKPSYESFFKYDKYPISKTVSLVLLPDEYKLKVDENSVFWDRLIKNAPYINRWNSLPLYLDTAGYTTANTKEYVETYGSEENQKKRIAERLKISNYLGDFSKHNDLHTGTVYFGLIPDYHNNCYVPAVSRLWSKENNAIERQSDSDIKIVFDRKNPETSRANLGVFYFTQIVNPIKPLILYEVQRQIPVTVTNEWKGVGSDFFEDWKRLGWAQHKNDDWQVRSRPTWRRQKGAEILSRGFSFMALCSYVPGVKPVPEYTDDYTDYCVIRSTWYTYQHQNHSIGAKYAPTHAAYMETGYTSKISQNTNWYLFGKVPALRVEAPYTNETNTWREFQIEITLPTKTETFDTIKILRSFNDVPNNFLQWEVINSDLKKGNIPVRVRTLVGDGNRPELGLLTDEEEAKIPKDFVVKIYICNKPIASGKKGYEIDRDTGEGYRNKYSDRNTYPDIPDYNNSVYAGYQTKNGYVPAYKGKNLGLNWEIRVQHLIALLCSAFFLTSWERSEPRGAIPNDIEVLSDSTNRYPKHSDGRSQLGISWVKPYHGFWFIAWTRFYAPSMQPESMRTLDEDTTKRFSLQGTNDWIFAEIPADLRGSGAFQHYKHHRNKVTEMNSNTKLAFMYGGYCFNELDWQFWEDTLIRNGRDRNAASRFLERWYGKSKAIKLDNSYNTVKANDNSSDTFNHRGFTKFLHIRNIIMKMHYFNYSDSTFNWWQGATYQHIEYRECMEDWNSLLLKDYLTNQTSFRTIKMKNADGFSVYNKLVVPGQDDITFSFSTFDTDIPPFMAQYMNPHLPNGQENVKFPLTHPDLERQPSITDTREREEFFRSKIEKLCKLTYDSMTKWNTFVKFEGTNWYASITLNQSSESKLGEEDQEGLAPTPPDIQGTSSQFSRPDAFWDFEFFTDIKDNIKGKEAELWDFENKIQHDVDVLINSKFELNVYGNKFPLKSKPYITENLLDIGLTVTPLHDIKQSLAAVYYAVSMNHNEQDVIESYIEVLKDEVATLQLNVYDRERLIRQIGMLGDEFAFNKQNIAFQRQENKFMSEFEHDWNYKEWKYGVARGATQIVGGVIDTALSFTSAGALAHGINLPTGATQVLRGSTFHPGFPDYYLPPGSAPIGIGILSRYGLPGGTLYGGAMSHGRGFAMPGYNFSRGFTIPSGYEGIRGLGTGLGRRIPWERTRPFHYGFGERLRHGFDWASGDANNFSRLAQVTNRARQVGHGIGGIVEGGLAIAEAYESWNIKDRYIKEKYSLAESKLSAQGNILNKRFEHERTNLLMDLHRMSANVVLPQLQAGIVYKLYNQAKGLNNVFMVQYFPSGRIKKYIHEYYREYGYPVLVRNFKCSGVKDIVGHIRYQYIYIMNHPNISIGEMIKARALMGVKLVPWSQFRDLDTEIDKYEKAQKLREYQPTYWYQGKPNNDGGENQNSGNEESVQES